MVSNTASTARMGRISEGGEFFGLEHYRFHDYKQLLNRGKWVIVSVTLVIALVVSIVSSILPNKYKATTVILVDPSKVAESFVQSTATISAAERLGLLQEQILSNTKLSQIIDSMGLYSDLKKTKTQDEILLQMRKDILVEPITFNNRDLQAFKISFISNNAETAARVANRLASLFIDENMRTREQQVLGTAEFFQRELEEAKQNLAEKANKMEALRTKYASELPESQTVHVQALASLQLELRGEMDGVSRAQQQKVYLQSLLASTPPVVDLDTSSTEDGSSGTRQQLAQLETRLDQLRSRYGPEFPDVKKVQAQVDDLKAQIKEEEKSASSVPKPQPVATRHNPVIESQVAALNEEIENHQKHERDLQSQIAYHESKLEGAPAAAGQLAAAQREYQTAEADYQRLQEHKFAADVSSDVENREKGERFLIIEPATSPAKPYAPNRLLIDLLGFVAGLPCSVFIVLGLEVINTTVKTRRELTARLAVPVLAEIPWIQTDFRKRGHFMREALAWTGNVMLALGYLAFVAIAFRRG